MIVTNGQRTYVVTTTTKDDLVKCIDINLSTTLWLPAKLVSQYPQVTYKRNGYK